MSNDWEYIKELIPLVPYERIRKFYIKNKKIIECECEAIIIIGDDEENIYENRFCDI